MSQIKAIYYPQPPAFLPSMQHPDAQRFTIAHPTRGQIYVDAVGGEPTMDEIDAVFNPPTAGGAEGVSRRQRGQELEELERRMSHGAPQEEINRQLLDLLKKE